jgi:hypothetical protein
MSALPDRVTDAYLFRDHPRETLASWCRRLHHFRFCRAVGGLANDADELVLAIATGSREVRAEVRARLKISGPGKILIAGVAAFVSEGEQATLVILSGADGNPYEVGEGDVEAAERIERAIERHPFVFLDPPRDGSHCVSPARHPELFALPGGR